MAVYCSRCGKQTRWTVWGVEEHLCDDVRRRLARREKQKQAVITIIYDYCSGPIDEIAEAIVAKLNQLGVTDE